MTVLPEGGAKLEARIDARGECSTGAVAVVTVVDEAINVLTDEPMTDETPLKNARNIVFTPHVAWAPVETRERLFGIVTENLRAFIAGKPQNTV